MLWNKCARLITGAILFFCIGMITGCGLFRPGMNPDELDFSPRHIEVPDVPFHAQEKYQCGPATLAMALNWSGVAVEPAELVPDVYTPAKKGSLQPEMIGATRRRGRLAYPIYGVDPLLKEVAAGHPVIVLQNLGFSWFPTWHYAVVIGYDLDEGDIVMHSGMSRRRMVGWKVFDRTWRRSAYWGMVVLPPGTLPASATEETYLNSVLGLEQVKNWTAASRAYEAALSRWHDSLGALMGLGNSRYRSGDLDGAVDAFRRAMANHSDSGAAHNNLAHVLAETGQCDEALTVIQSAVSLGGPGVDLYRKTEAEIRDKIASGCQ